jgi:hypothetical protein
MPRRLGNCGFHSVSPAEKSHRFRGGYANDNWSANLEYDFLGLRTKRKLSSARSRIPSFRAAAVVKTQPQSWPPDPANTVATHMTGFHLSKKIVTKQRLKRSPSSKTSRSRESKLPVFSKGRKARTIRGRMDGLGRGYRGGSNSPGCSGSRARAARRIARGRPRRCPRALFRARSRRAYRSQRPPGRNYGSVARRKEPRRG